MDMYEYKNKEKILHIPNWNEQIKAEFSTPIPSAPERHRTCSGNIQNPPVLYLLPLLYE